MRQYQCGKDRCIWDEVGRTGVSGKGEKDRATWASGVLGHPSGKAILQQLAPKHLVRPTHPDALDAHFVVADVRTWRYCFLTHSVLKEAASSSIPFLALGSDSTYLAIVFLHPFRPGRVSRVSVDTPSLNSHHRLVDYY